MATSDGDPFNPLTGERTQLRRFEAELRSDVRRLGKLAKWYELGGNTCSTAGLRKAYRRSLFLARQAREAKVMADQVHCEAVRETSIIRYLRTMEMTARFFSEADLKERYQALVFALHPDRQPVKRKLQATKQMVRVNSAFQHLLATLPSATHNRRVTTSVRVPTSRRIA